MSEDAPLTSLQTLLLFRDDLRTALDLNQDKVPKVYRWNDIDKLEFPEDRWLVRNLIPKEGLTTIASVSGEGKSLLAMHLAKCLTDGTPWFGHEGFKTEKRRVLYLNLEMSLSEMQRRGRKIGLDVSNEDLIFLNEDNFNLNIKDGDDYQYSWLLNEIDEKKINVLIVDTFRAASGGLHEDKAEDVREFFKKFQVLKNSGVSVIFLEHVRKPNQMEGKIPKKEQVLGSQDKTANLEILLMVRRDEQSGHHHIYQRKNRLGEEIKPFGVKISDVSAEDGTERLSFEYMGEIEDDSNKKDLAKELVIQVLSSGDRMDRKQLGELTRKQVGDKNLRAALRELRDEGEIDFTKDGKRHIYFIPKEIDHPVPLETLTL
jgi:hypothetical protein